MKKVIKKHPTPDEYAVGPMIHWSDNIQRTLHLLWSNIELTNPHFYQSSFKFDRPMAHEAEYIRNFFNERHVFAVINNYSDPNVGDRSWLFLMALHERYSKYKTPCYF